MNGVIDIDNWKLKCGGDPIIVSEIGSHAYGFSTPESDSDRYGIFVKPTEKMFTIRGIGKETYDFKDGDGDVTLHEVGKFFKLASKGNPTILNMLFKTPPDFIHHELGQELYDNRKRFLYKGSLAPFLGYADSQYKKFLKNRSVHSSTGRPTGKWSAHFFRLIWQGIHLAKTGDVVLMFDEDRVKLLNDLRHDRRPELMYELAPDAMNILRQYVNGEKETALPDKLDEDYVNDLLIRIRKAWYA